MFFRITTRFIPDLFDPFLSPRQPIPLVEARAKSSPVRHPATTAQVGHKGVNPFTCGDIIATITPPVLRAHLLEAGYKSDHVWAALNPNDKQDVTLAYSLLQDIWSLPALACGPPGRIQAHEALRLLGSLCYHLLVPYICVDMSIEDQLEHLSYAGHLALILYVHDNACGDFLPTALYIDIMLMIKNVFFCVAKAKVDTPDEDFNLVLLGTDRLESLFGCLRTIIGNDANVETISWALA